MSLEKILSLANSKEEIKELRNKIQKSGLHSKVIAPSFLRPFLFTLFFDSLNVPVLIVTSSEKAEEMAFELKSYLSDDKVFYFPDWENFVYERVSPAKEIVGKRMQVLDKLKKREKIVVVASFAALMQKIIPSQQNIYSPVNLKTDIETDLEDLTTKLVKAGYKRTSVVEEKGEFCVRGGLIDIFPSTGDFPLRIEFFGDKIESIREFEILSQRSIRNIEQFEVFPSHEIILSKSSIERALSLVDLNKNTSQWLREDIVRISEGITFNGIERYIPFLFEDLSSFFEYFPLDGMVFFDEPRYLYDEGRDIYSKNDEYLQETKDADLSLNSFMFSVDEAVNLIEQKRIDFVSIQTPDRADLIGRLEAVPVDSFQGDLGRLKETIADLEKDGFTVVLVLGSKGQADRFIELLNEWGFVSGNSKHILSPGINIFIGSPSKGFIFSSLKLAVFAESDIFKKRKKYRQDKQTSEAISLSDFYDLRRGDYVVHLNYGIGRFGGLLTKEVDNISREYMLIEYARNDKVYVPFTEMHKVQRYIGADNSLPKISRLGTNKWNQAKKKARESVRKLAFDLLELYAQRESVNGYSFGPDSVWQKELEESFPFEETADQAQAIIDTKTDMEKNRPMDRLICGDVGYGKTEVALRAVFKAVIEGRQAAVLVPTTVLAEQHYNTFSERLASFPIRVDVLSRFKSKSEQKEILKDLTEGKTDIIIGTHRLLQKDVRLKALQMSLASIRDLSVINTPPEDRYPVVTYVGEFDREMVKHAIQRELARKGQIFYVHNRVNTISRIAFQLRNIVPSARIGIAHGQMSEHELERAMDSFVSRKYDVLVCTTIIESGLDIPSVNTLIVDESDRMGLSTLYQLRGRVGRAHHRAYAYFFFKNKMSLNTAAYERLKTISEFTELGSGIRIAMRDLEIRGAGNLLGPEQHGYMSEVGFELYCQLLKEAVDELRGRLIKKPLEVRIDLPVEAYIPKSYVSDEALRIEAYQKIAAVNNFEDLKDAMDELTDRYGNTPLPVKDLEKICHLKILAKKGSVSEIRWEKGKIFLKNVRINKKTEEFLHNKYRNLRYEIRLNTVVIEDVKEGKILSFLEELINDIINFV
ncbi:MAG: transcription-repair coupling factor [Actinobacteria bacterium]|nr:transcription-repair coupling factor [Actinomycetota bacterium]